jgi:hypothetical protein
MMQPLGNCPGCGGDEPFEQVHAGLAAGDPCPDVDGECREWVCPGCGAGLFMGLVSAGAVFTSTVLAGTAEQGQVQAGQSARAA